MATARSPGSGATPSRATERALRTSSSTATTGTTVSWARGRRARGEPRERPARARRQKGDAFATLARTTLEWALFDFALAQIGAVGAGIYANSSAKDVAYVLAHSEAVGILCEDAAQVAKVDAERGVAPGPPARPHLRRPPGPRSRRAWRSVPAPDSARRGRRSDRRGRPLHVHLHVRHDRAAEGVHDPAPQLLRDGLGRRPSPGLLPRERPDAPLPPARAQLRSPDAPARPVRRATRSRSFPIHCRRRRR